MKVSQLIEFLQRLPPEASIHLDDDQYPAVDGCYLADPIEFNGDTQDAPPPNVVLLEVTYPTKESE